MLVINILLYIASLVLLLSFMISFVNSAQKDRKHYERKLDLAGGTLLVGLFVVLVFVYTKVNGGMM